MDRTDYVLPRYVFRGTGVGCGVPRHALHCLCDVNITNPAPIFKKPLMFAKLALKELDDHEVSPRNIVEFASILLGCYDEFLRCPLPPLTPYVHTQTAWAITMEAEKPARLAERQAISAEAEAEHQNRADSAVTLASNRSTRTVPLTGAPPEWATLEPEVQQHLQFHWAIGTPWSRLRHLVPTDIERPINLYYRKRESQYRGKAKYDAKQSRKVSA